MRVNLFRVGLLLFLTGFALTIIAALLPLVASLVGGAGGQPSGVSGGGCVLIMFIPICFGFGEAALPMMAIALTMVAVLTLIGLIFLRKVYRET